MTKQVQRLLLPLLLLAVASKADRGPWGPGVSTSFDCSMRQAAYQYGQKLQPRQGNFSALYYALDLAAGSDCHVPLQATTAEQEEKIFSSQSRRLGKEVISKAVFVSLNGEDPGPKTATRKQTAPYFASIPLALDYAVKNNLTHVILRQGIYYLENTLYLTPAHSHLALMAYPGEEVVLSGGKLLPIDHWDPYKTDGDNNIWVTHLPNLQLGDFPGLQINNERATRARYPNLPGGIEVSCGYGCMINSKLAHWTPPDMNKYGQPDYYTDTNPKHNRPNAGWFENYTIGVHGLCNVYDPPVSYWCSEHPSGGGAFAFRTPSGMIPVNVSVLPNAPYANTDEAILFVWRPARWANWMMTVERYDPTTGNITFGKGGNQGARGENSGGDWFIENVMEELDHPGEFYYDKRTQKLYLFYNGTGPPPLDATMVVPQLRTLINMTGTQWNPVQNVTIQGLTLRATRYTYMDAHGVPSGGDWALERNGAVFLQGTQGINIKQCQFERLDSNGLMISGYNRHTTVHQSDFAYIGGTAIASWGYTNETDADPGRPGVVLENAPAAGVDGTDGEHPRYNRIEACTAREVGLYEKQASFYMQAKTAYTTITGNVFFNGPRAGINFNDGFAGGDVIANNLVFSTCRESGDHGPFNSWDRQPFFTLNDGDDKPSMDMEWRTIHHNFLIDNYSPQENVDNDDGSRYFHTHHNFMVYGRTGMKNDFGGHDNHHYNNVYAQVVEPLGICNQLEGHENHFVDNKVVIRVDGAKVGSFKCQGPGAPVIKGNQYYTPSGKIEECKMPLEEWQKQGNDPNSTVAKVPADDVIIQWAKDLLGF